MNQKVLKIRSSKKLEEKISDEQREFATTGLQKINYYLSNYKKIYSNGTGNERKVAITFDDAPDAYCTPKILDILKRLKVQANFSVIGVYIEDNKEMVKRIYEENHRIINHTYNHHDLSLLTKEELFNEINRTEELIYNVIGVKPSVIRPPFGILSDSAVEEILRLNYHILLWSYNTYDWLAETSNEILEDMCDSIRPGEIILMHSYENKEATVEALEPLILGLLERGFEIVPINELLKIDCYY